jgi:hypothetical protein
VFSNFQEKIIMRMGTDLVFLKTPEFSIEEKVEIGSGFHFALSEREIVVVSERQVLVWRRPEFVQEKSKG